jgi:hypothetical protein
VCDGLCRSVLEPQRDLGTQASPSRTRSPDPKVVAQSFVDNARMATPPSAADEREVTPQSATDSRMVTPPRADDAGARGALGDIGTSASPRVIDIDPINARPGGMEEAWSRIRPRLTKRRKVRGRLAHRYLILLRRARGCRDERLTGMTLLGRRTSSTITKICGLCGTPL